MWLSAIFGMTVTPSLSVGLALWLMRDIGQDFVPKYLCTVTLTVGACHQVKVFVTQRCNAGHLHWVYWKFLSNLLKRLSF